MTGRIDDEDKVTPDDILRFFQEMADTGGDPAVLDRQLKEAIKEAGGTLDALARVWTEQNIYERRLAEFRTEIRRRSRPPRSDAGTSQPGSLPKITAEEEAQAMLRELVRRFPDVARDVLGEDGTAQP